MNDVLRGLLAVGMEDAGADVVEETGSGESETVVVEIIEAAGEVSQASDAVEQLEGASEALEAFAVMLDASIATGGIGMESASYVNLGVAAVMNSLGLQSIQLPAMEEFEGETDQLQATEVASEGIKETLKKMWETIKSAIARVWDAIQRFFGKLFGSIGQLEKKAADLKKRASGAKGKAKDEEYTVSKALSLGSDSPEKAVADTASAVKAAFDGVSKATQQYHGLVKDSASDIVNGKKVDTSGIEGAGGKFTASIAGGLTLKSIEEGFGFKTESGEAKEGKVKGTALNVATLAGNVETLAKALADNKKAVAELKRSQDDVVRKAEEAVRSTDKNMGRNFFDQRAVRGVMKAAQKNGVAALAKLSSGALKTGYAGLALGNKVLAGYKEKSAKA
jgi:hypothetical protein